MPREWSLAGLTRGTPATDPVRDTSGGRAGAQGPGAVSWQRRLAPRHRDVVRKFFTARDKR